MIYTVTVNPSLDYHMRLSVPVTLGEIHRADSETVVASGKGVNVSAVLHNLGAKTLALGFLAGESGRMYQRLLGSFPHDFVFLKDGMTRINVKVYAQQETAFNAAGPAVSAADYEKLAAKLSALTAGDMLVLSGNLQKNTPFSYADLAKIAIGKGAQFTVDTTGSALLDCLPLHPYLIKPNLEELGELFSVTVQDTAQALCLCRSLQQQGARNVLVSMGGGGAILLTESGEAFSAVCEKRQPVLTTVGAGDSMVAGFLAAAAHGKPPEACLRHGIAAGSATVYAGKLAEKEQIEALLPFVKITRLNA